MVKKSKRYGVILICKDTGHCYVLRRINYALSNRLNNIRIPYKCEKEDMILSMYPGVLHESKYEFPKGRKENNESPFQCALREFYEETGLMPNEYEVLGKIVQDYRGGNNKQYSLQYFVLNAKPVEFPQSDITIVHMPECRIFSDNFNTVLHIKWEYIRKFFMSNKQTTIVEALDAWLVR